jgi:hypothetical protein
MEDVRIFYVHLEYFTAMWYILWPFGIVSSYLAYFSPFWYIEARNIWQPCVERLEPFGIDFEGNQIRLIKVVQDCKIVCK